MTEIDELKAIQKRVNKISIKVNQALRIRQTILDRIKSSCKILLTNPTDKRARNRLMINLDRERKFLDIIRRGSKEGISDLNKAKKHIGKLEAPDDVKASIGSLILNLTDAMRFTQKKIKVLEKRVKQGERLEYKDYADTHIKKFLETLEEEKKLDVEIYARLKGQLPKIIPPFQALARRLGMASLASMIGGVFVGGYFAGHKYEILELIEAGVEKQVAIEVTTPTAMYTIIIFAGISFIIGLLGAAAISADKESELEAEVKKLAAQEATK